MNIILNNRGPLYLVEYGKKEYIVIPRDSEKEGKGWWVLDQDGDLSHEYDFMKKLGVHIIGLDFDQLLNMFFDENETVIPPTLCRLVVYLLYLYLCMVMYILE
jgi:hypothetical protein